MTRLSGLFSVPRLAFVYVSHRVLRWTIIPAMLPILPVLSITLAARTGDPSYLVMAALMAAGALASAFAWYRLHRERSAGILTPLFYFVFMNAAVWVGAMRFVRGRQQVTWERAARHAAVQGV